MYKSLLDNPSHSASTQISLKVHRNMDNPDHAELNMDDGLYPVTKYLKIAGGWWLLSLLLLFTTVFFVTRPSWSTIFDYSQSGQVGDTFGGISAPFIGSAAAILTFLAFYMQLKANQMHSRQFVLDKKDKLRDKHEERIFFLIAQNRNIVENMTIGKDVSGARCFSQMNLEYRVIYEIVQGFFSDRKDDHDFMANISYLILFNGLTVTSEQLNNAVFKDVPRMDELIRLFDNIEYINLSGFHGFEKLPNRQQIDGLLNELGYVPIQGHTDRLGHYFRNFFHILKYTNSLSSSLMSELDKYEIIKSLRSQLTSDEQIIVYFNSISFYGTPMRDAGYIITYQLIKNIPLPLVEFAGDIRKRYPEVDFEWDEIVERAESGA